MKKTLNSLIILLIYVIFINFQYSYGAFADFSDEEASKETQHLIEEQKKSYDATKSSNNYLKNLKVEGYKLTPEFDKQTLKYNLSIPNNIGEININAEPDDPKAKVQGLGKIRIEENKREYRIDVTAESGTVRTYLLLINSDEKVEKDNDEEDIIDENIQEDANLINEENKIEVLDNDKKNSDNVDIQYGIVPIIISILIVLIIIIRKNIRKHKAKRRK